MDTPIRKLCVNCRFYLPGMNSNTDKCSHMDCSSIEVVRGTWEFGYCIVKRHEGQACGPEALLFVDKKILEPKEEDHV